MANNCYNYIEIDGKKEDIQKLKELIVVEKEDGEVVKMDNIRPYENGDDVYEIWGTKWFDVSSFEFNETEAIIILDTAWSPCLPISKLMSEMFNLEITHEYEECGCDFEGVFKVKNGVIIEHTQTEYKPVCQLCGEKHFKNNMVLEEEDYSYYCKDCIKKDLKLLERLCV